MSSAAQSTIIYSYFFIAIAVGTGVSYIARQFIKQETSELKDQLHKIMYALYNDGKTGLINKVDQLIENQQTIKVDVEVLKAKAETHK